MFLTNFFIFYGNSGHYYPISSGRSQGTGLKRPSLGLKPLLMFIARIMVFQFHLRAINDLVFCSILDISLIFNYFLEDENQVYFLLIFILYSQLNFLA